MNSSIWPLDGILTGTTTVDQSEPESNGTTTIDQSEPESNGTTTVDQSEPESNGTTTIDLSEPESNGTTITDQSEPESNGTTTIDQSEPESNGITTIDQSEPESNGTTTVDQSGPESNANERILRVSQTPRLKPHYQIVLYHIEDTRWQGESYSTDEIQSAHSTATVIFWPSTRPKNAIPRWCTGKKWHIPIASNRKRSRGRIKAYNMGQGEGPTVPLQWCTGRKWPVNCMTVISTWWRLNIRFQRSSGRSCGRWIII